MIDFHAHILPEVDDGSHSLKETMDMLRLAKGQGVTTMIGTPHFYATKQSFSTFMKKRTEACNLVNICKMQEVSLPQIRMGAEVYYFPGMGKAEVLPELCMEGTKCILLEMPFVQWTTAMLEDIQQMIKKRNLTVILAHIERYYEFQKKKDIWERILELPVILQINAGSFSNRKKCKVNVRLIKAGYPILLGSDCHNLERRPPNLIMGKEFVLQKFGEQVLSEMNELGRRLLANEW